MAKFWLANFVRREKKMAKIYNCQKMAKIPSFGVFGVFRLI